MLLWLWKNIRGYVIIEVTGFSVERFMNLATNKGLYLWNLRREGNALVMCVSVKGFKLLKHCLKKTGCRVRVKEKVGLPFFLFRYRKRKMFFIGIALCGLILFLLSSRIWTIEIDGNRTLSRNAVMSILKEESCEIGNVKKRIDCDEVEKSILNNHQEIAWISIEKKGTGLFVSIVETIEDPTIIDLKASPTNIVSTKNCIIEEIVVNGGTPLVKKGDVVGADEILITGEVVRTFDDGSTTSKYVEAKGTVVGKTFYKLSEKLPLKYVEKQYTGVMKKGYALRLGKKKVRFYKPKHAFQHYDLLTQPKDFKFINLKLPISVITEIYLEYKPINEKHTVDEAKELLKKKIEKKIGKLLHEEVIEVVDQKLEFTKVGDSVQCDCQITLLEDIKKVNKLDPTLLTEENPEES